MSEATYIPLEISLEEEHEELIALIACEIDFERLDINSSIGCFPENLLLMTALHRGLAKFCGLEEQEAWQTSYRGFFFASEVAELVGKHDFVIDIPKMLSFLTTKEQMQYEVNDYLDIRAMTGAVIDAFLDDIDFTKTGKFERIAKLSAGLTFMTIEDAMRETYLTLQAAKLEAEFKL